MSSNTTIRAPTSATTRRAPRRMKVRALPLTISSCSRCQSCSPLATKLRDTMSANTVSAGSASGHEESASPTRSSMRACKMTAAAAFATRSTKSSVNTNTPAFKFLRIFSRYRLLVSISRRFAKSRVRASASWEVIVLNDCVNTESSSRPSTGCRREKSPSATANVPSAKRASGCARRSENTDANASAESSANIKVKVNVKANKRFNALR